jgi:hypothetical protein
MCNRWVRARARAFGEVTLVFAQFGYNLPQALVIGFTMSNVAELII